MTIPKNLRLYVSGECRRVAENMRQASTHREKMYYFSALYGAPQRVFNIEFSREMIHLHVVALWAHTSISGRLNSPELVSPVPGELFDSLTQTIDKLADRIEKAEEFNDLLEEICMIGYAATGNGFYLAKVGRLGPH